jgi:very-short-patch-repair endonuclease
VPSVRPNLRQLAAKQSGAFTWQQALVEYTRTEIDTLVRNGVWVRTFRGVFREATTPRRPALSLEAARLSMGVAAVTACRDTAAQLFGFAVLDDPAVHVLATGPRRTRSEGLVVHRDVVSPEDLVTVRGVATTHAARTAIDLARTYDRLDALAVLDLALRRGVTRARLEAELERHAGKRGFRQAAELLGYASAKAESPMESRTRMRCIDAGLPHPEPQVVINHNGVEKRVDLGWERWKIGLEYESDLWHKGQHAARDNPRHNWLTTSGWTMYYVGPRDVYQNPERFTDLIGEAIESAVVQAKAAESS